MPMTTRPYSRTARVRFPPAGSSHSSSTGNHVACSSTFATGSSPGASSRKARRSAFGLSLSTDLRGGSGFGGSGGGQASPRRSARCFARHMPSRVSASTPATSSMRRCTSARRSSRAVSRRRLRAAGAGPCGPHRLASPLQSSGSRDGSLSLNVSRGHPIPRRRTQDGTERIGEPVPARSLQVLGFALRAPSWVSTNIRICPKCVYRERSQAAPHTEPFFSRRQLTARVGQQKPPRSDPRGLRRVGPEDGAFRALRVSRGGSRLVCLWFAIYLFGHLFDRPHIDLLGDRVDLARHLAYDRTVIRHASLFDPPSVPLRASIVSRPGAATGACDGRHPRLSRRRSRGP
jgi:hypothetical protein